MKDLRQDNNGAYSRAHGRPLPAFKHEGVMADCTHVNATGAVSKGGANTQYHILTEQVGREPIITRLKFHDGPLAEPKDLNGIPGEALLAVMIDRYAGFQKGPFASEENAEVLQNLKRALELMHSRSARRETKKIEGTHSLDTACEGFLVERKAFRKTSDAAYDALSGIEGGLQEIAGAMGQPHAIIRSSKLRIPTAETLTKLADTVENCPIRKHIVGFFHDDQSGLVGRMLEGGKIIRPAGEAGYALHIEQDPNTPAVWLWLEAKIVTDQV